MSVLGSPFGRTHTKVIYSLNSKCTHFKAYVDGFAAQFGFVLYHVTFTELLLLVHFVAASDQINRFSASNLITISLMTQGHSLDRFAQRV